jgi:hypothetical protein
MDNFLTISNLWIILILITPIASFQNYHSSVRLFYGIAIASKEMLAITPRGLQDHLTNPKYNWLFFTIQAMRLLLLIFIFYVGGITHGLLSIVFAFSVGYALYKNLILPAPNSRFWAYGLLRTVSNREADYKRDGDLLRSNEMRAVKESLIEYLENNK